MTRKASKLFKNFIESSPVVETSRDDMNLERLVAELIDEYGLQAVLEAVSESPCAHAGKYVGSMSLKLKEFTYAGN